MKKIAVVASLAMIELLLALPASAQQAPPTGAAPPVVYLNQAWSQEDREWYYNFSQGSAVISYDIYLNLEVAGGQELFRSDANSERYGLIPQERKSAIQSGRIADRAQQDDGCDADQGLAGPATTPV